MTYLLPQTPSGGGGITLQGQWKFDTAITASDPGNKKFKYDNATLANITNIYISETTNNNNDASNILGILAAGNRLYIQQDDDASRAVLVEVSGTPVDNTGWWTIPVTVVSSLALMGNNNVCGVLIDLSAAGGGAGGTLVTLAASGASINFGSLPSGITAFKMIFEGVSVSTTGLPRIQLGNSGGLLTTGYVGSTWSTDDGGGSVAGVAITDIDLITAGMDIGLTIPGANVTSGIIDWELIDATNHIWQGRSVMQSQAATSEYFLAVSRIQLTTELTQIGVLASAGTLDLGNVHLKY